MSDNQSNALFAEACQVINRLNSDDPDFDDCSAAVALIHKMVAEIRGPDGHATWKDAAIAERMHREAQRRRQLERDGAQPSDALSTKDRNQLRSLIDAAWNAATESQQVPSPQWADEIIDKWRASLGESIEDIT